jgi:membrane protease YdiL (CAAX protease family)
LSEGKRSVMFTRLHDTNKATIFTVLVLLMALVAALVIRALGITSGFVAAALYMFTPAEAALIMLLIVTRDGFSRESWKVVGLHRLGLNVWWIAFLAALLVSLVATAIVWATPLASVVVPEDGVGGRLIGFVIQVVLFTFTLALGEEIGWRGYLLPMLLSVGWTRALVLVGLIHAAWHMPMIFLTPLYHSAGNRLIVLPLFVGTIVAASFFLGYLRIYTGSVWPASIGHSVHNAAWGTLAAFTATSSPVVVNEYLAGDNGILILVGTVIAAIWVRRRLGKEPTLPRPSDTSGEAPAV